MWCDTKMIHNATARNYVLSPRGLEIEIVFYCRGFEIWLHILCLLLLVRILFTGKPAGLGPKNSLLYKPL
jgi:hypothetical protein